MQNLIKFHHLVHKILSINEILKITKGHNSVKNLRTLTLKNPNLDLIMVNAYPKFGRIPSIRLQDTEQKQNFANYQGP